MGIDKIQKDIQSIRSWPFDLSALAKVLTIVLSTTAILLSRLVAQYPRDLSEPGGDNLADRDPRSLDRQ